MMLKDWEEEDCDLDNDDWEEDTASGELGDLTGVRTNGSSHYFLTVCVL